ncbi:hypothetical protein ACMFMG_006321, partial [Clarireedia jacksonii]
PQSKMAIRAQRDHEGLQVVSQFEVKGLESPVTKDLKFQPAKEQSAYGKPMKVIPPPIHSNHGSIGESPPMYKPSDQSTVPPSPAHPPPKKRICGLRKRVFWILMLLLLLVIIALAVGLGVGLGTKNSSSSSSSAPTSTSTISSSSSTPSTSTSSAVAIPSPSGQFCISGTGPNNYLGLCSFSCNYAYCPSPCTCTAYSANAIPEPPVSNTPGFPLPGEDVSYVGLCKFTCNHGYCPEAACTTILASGSSLGTAAAKSSTASA